MPDEDIGQTGAWINDHHHGYDGMVARNQARLLMLKDPKHRAALLGLPKQLMELARRSDSERGAYLAQRAVAIELLLQTVLRIGNIAALRFGQHVVDTTVGKSGCLFVMLKANEIKNRQKYQTELGVEAAAMLRLYRDAYLPRLRNGGDGFLFPGNGGAKGSITLGHQISETIREHTGLQIHPHLFRGIAVYLYLKHHPDGYIKLKSILGDRQLSTIIRHYSFLDQIEVRQDYQDTIAAERQLLGRPRKEQGRGGRS